MSDRGKIFVGLLLFLVLITFPFWFSIANQKSGYRPDLEYPSDADACVEPIEYMQALHMDLLDEWRDSVVRDGNRLYLSSTGATFDMSLTGTCIGCHSSKADFCVRCHNYAGVSPYCWDCHIESPAEGMGLK